MSDKDNESTAHTIHHGNPSGCHNHPAKRQPEGEDVIAMLDSWPCVQGCDNGAIPYGPDSDGHFEFSQCQFCDEREKVRAQLHARDAEVERLSDSLTIDGRVIESYESLAEKAAAEIVALRLDLAWALAQIPPRCSTVRLCPDCEKPTSKVRPSLRCKCGEGEGK